MHWWFRFQVGMIQPATWELSSRVGVSPSRLWSGRLGTCNPARTYLIDPRRAEFSGRERRSRAQIVSAAARVDVVRRP